MQSVLNRYLDKIIKDNRTIDARGVMQVNRMIELTMDEVFINLSVRMGNTYQKAGYHAAHMGIEELLAACQYTEKRAAGHSG